MIQKNFYIIFWLQWENGARSVILENLLRIKKKRKPMSNVYRTRDNILFAHVISLS